MSENPLDGIPGSQKRYRELSDMWEQADRDDAKTSLTNRAHSYGFDRVEDYQIWSVFERLRRETIRKRWAVKQVPKLPTNVTPLRPHK